MNQILRMMGTTKYKNLDYGALLPGDIFSSPKNDLMGLILQRDCLLMRAKAWSPFRVKYENLQLYAPFKIRRSRKTLKSIDLNKYFAVNCDNPYALYHVVHHIINEAELIDFTQYPPLYYNKAKLNRLQELREMEKNAEVGDTVFMYARNNRVSRLIRKVDKGPWSHVGMVGRDKTISHMTTAGMQLSRFTDFMDENLDIALYRLNIPLDNEKKSKILEAIDQQHAQNPKYSWIKVLAIFLRKSLNIPVPITHTPSAIIYSNQFKLIRYC